MQQFLLHTVDFLNFPSQNHLLAREVDDKEVLLLVIVTITPFIYIRLYNLLLQIGVHTINNSCIVHLALIKPSEMVSLNYLNPILTCLFHDNHAFMQQLRCTAILHMHTQRTPTQKWTYPLTTPSEWNENQKHLANSYINPALAPSSHHICFCYCLRGASFCWLWNLVKSVPRCPPPLFAIFRREKRNMQKVLKKSFPLLFSLKLSTRQPFKAQAGLQKVLGDDDDSTLVLFHPKGSLCQTKHRLCYNAARVCQYDLDCQRLLSGVIAWWTHRRLRILVSH